MISWSEILIRLSLAFLFGALIGLERERKNWTAGLRTHIMVCIGSCLIMVVSAYGFFDVLGKENIVLDPSRVAAQVVSGIGFIGAGTILFLRQGTVHGLTTAAGLWTVAAIGLATGGGLYFAAAATTVIALIVLWALQPLERLYSKKFKRKTLHIITDLNVDNAGLLKNLLSANGVSIQSFTVDRQEDSFVFELTLDNAENEELDYLMDELKSNAAIKEVTWMQ